jgi:hypothetical protein
MLASAAVASSWKRVGDVPPGALTDARLQLHHAAQIAVSAAISYLPARPDDSHTALTWVASHGALVTEPIAAQRAFRVGVRVEDLTLHALDGAFGVTATFALSGRTVADANAWLVTVATEAGLDGARFTSRKHYTIPVHPVADGAPFSVGTGHELAELAKYWGNAGSLLDEVVRVTDGASPVRTWPHHFDIATLIELPGSGARRTIGVGQSPGDGSYAQPYWYVGPYPYPSTRDLPSLAGGGHWHTSGWVGAALPASDYAAAEDQRAQVAAFVESAVAACRSLLAP